MADSRSTQLVPVHASVHPHRLRKSNRPNGWSTRSIWSSCFRGSWQFQLLSRTENIAGGQSPLTLLNYMGQLDRVDQPLWALDFSTVVKVDRTWTGHGPLQAATPLPFSFIIGAVRDVSRAERAAADHGRASPADNDGGRRRRGATTAPSAGWVGGLDPQEAKGASPHRVSCAKKIIRRRGFDFGPLIKRNQTLAMQAATRGFQR